MKSYCLIYIEEDMRQKAVCYEAEDEWAAADKFWMEHEDAIDIIDWWEITE